MTTQTWWLYIIECADTTYYTGITTDVAKRIEKHNSGKGAKYTQFRAPVKLLYCEQHENRSEASKKEAQIKKLTRTQKKELAESFARSVAGKFHRN